MSDIKLEQAWNSLELCNSNYKDIKTVVITAGGTTEPIDSVRKITNMSTGKLGSMICNEILKSDNTTIYYICPKTAVKPNADPRIHFIYVDTVQELSDAISKTLQSVKVDYFIHSMAVSDYEVDYVTNVELLTKSLYTRLSNSAMIDEFNDIIKDTITSGTSVIDRSSKISSNASDLIIKLKPTQKVISMIKRLEPDVKLIGFKLLNSVTEEELCNVAWELLKKNDCDYVVANDLATIRQGIHKGIIINKEYKKAYADSKEDIAYQLARIVNA